MAVRNRSTIISYTDEVNSQGVATQVELDNTRQLHIDNYHNNEPFSVFEDGIKYYYSSALDKYLSYQTFMMDFSDNDTTTQNIYLFQKKNIRCNYTFNTLPYPKDILIQKIEVSLDRAKSGYLFDIDDDSGNTMFPINIPTSQKYTLIDDFNQIFNYSQGIRVYVKGTTLKRPVVKLWMKLIKN